MEVNSSSSNIISRYSCLYSGSATFIYSSFTAVKCLLVFPLYILVFYFGFQRWRQQRSFKTTSHTDVFTYHMAAMALMSVVSDMVFYLGYLTGDSELTRGGIYLYGITFPGELLVHCLTCVERYLAVVHPITYMRMRQRGGVRIRNISIGCVWIMAFGFSGVTIYYYPTFPDIPCFCLISASVIIISFCSLSILFVLNRSGPGDRERDGVDQSKQKAFHTILAILGVLLVWFVVLFVTLFLTAEELDIQINKCAVFVSGFWFNIPSTLVLPVLFLNRAGKLTCC